MHWNQIVNPMGNIWLSVLVAAAPVLFIFWALIIKKMKGYQASLCAIMIAAVIAVFIYGMPLKIATLAIFHGALYGIFPICWIVIGAMFLFNITVQSGQFEVIRNFMASITPDRRLQALLIAFSFGSFLEGTAGFGAPVAITAAMLTGLGFNPLYAAGLCLIANTAPVAFGSVGIPITVASQVTGISEMSISKMVGRTLPFLSLILPFYLVLLMSGFRKTIEILPAILVSGASFALLQFVSSNFLGPALPDVIAGIGSIISLVFFLRHWKPREEWHFEGESSLRSTVPCIFSGIQLMRAWTPFILLTVLVICWGLPPVKQALDSASALQFNIPGLHLSIADGTGNLLPGIFKFNYLSAAGTAILLAALLSVPLIGLTYRHALKIFGQTLVQLRFPILTIATILGFAYLMNASGITLTMAEAMAKTGYLFPFFSPVLGWIGVFITGSDTSANALFCKVQSDTAVSVGVNPVITVAANVSGGVMGKMISPQSVIIASAAGGFTGRESELFRFTVKHSFILLFCVCLLVVAQAYLFPGWSPPNQQVTSSSIPPAVTTGYLYLITLGVLLVAFVAGMKLHGKKRNFSKVVAVK